MSQFFAVQHLHKTLPFIISQTDNHRDTVYQLLSNARDVNPKCNRLFRALVSNAHVIF